MHPTPKLILPVIIISQFFCTSLWFAGNSVIQELILNFNLNQNALGNLTSAVQLGFIFGTLLFAIFCISDRYSPSKVFFVCSLLGAATNLSIIWPNNSYVSILSLRFFTGFFLAGIYPVGMKIASDYFDKGLGKSLGYLVGALVMGTALPHLLKDINGDLPWQFVLIATSVMATIGGILIISFVTDGPYRTPSKKLELTAIGKVFRSRNFRIPAFGYFGHMWELYTFWAFTPFILKLYENKFGVSLNISLLSFTIIATGGIACIISGHLAQRFSTRRIAFGSLALSLICCLIFPIIFSIGSQAIFIIFLIFWGMVVIADSPLFSTLVAQNAEPKFKGTALTIVNSIGFFITIISIQLLDKLKNISESPIIFVVLAIGPLIGLINALINRRKKD